MVGIGAESNAKEWQEANKTTFPFTLVLDPENKLYRDLGLKRSVGGVWNIPVLVGFAEKLVAGKLHLEHFEGDDLHVLAGDFIADSKGELVLAYGSVNSDDRPSVDAILAALDKATAT